MDSNQDYHAYLLRLWRVGQADQPRWRVLLERVDTHEQRSFASLEEAFEYLRIILSTPHNMSPEHENRDGSQRY